MTQEKHPSIQSTVYGLSEMPKSGKKTAGLYGEVSVNTSIETRHVGHEQDFIDPRFKQNEF